MRVDGGWRIEDGGLGVFRKIFGRKKRYRDTFFRLMLQRKSKKRDKMPVYLWKKSWEN